MIDHRQVIRRPLITEKSTIEKETDNVVTFAVDPRVGKIEIKQAVINSSHTSILLVDSSKVNKVKIAHFADIQNFDVIITDTGVPSRYIDIAKVLGVVMYCV